MTARERYVRLFHFQPVDYVPDEEFGWWDETLTAWHKQGLPSEINDNGKGDFFFGFAQTDWAPVNQGLIPGFEHKVISEDENHVIFVDGSGVTQMANKGGRASIPKYIRFPLETRDDWEDFKRRMDPTDPRRIPSNIDEIVERLKTAENPVGIGMGSLFGWIRNWMGFENLAMLTIDDPEWVEEMVDYLADFIIACAEPVLQKMEKAGVKLDVVSMWEDICFNNGPMVSPKFFRAVVTPRYKRITDRVRKVGCDLTYLDCDGDVTQLVGPWLEGGVNIMFPIEIRGGSDPQQMRDTYGHEVLLKGGVDKMALIEGKEAILADLKRLDPLIRDGGFIPHVDHRVPPDVTYENYLYYLREKRAWLGIPEPPPYEERLEELRKRDEIAARNFTRTDTVKT